MTVGEAKTHKTAVVIIPPQEAWPPIQAIRQAHDRHHRRWMPHITLLYPFRPRARFDAASVQLAKACGEVQPFGIELGAFRFFRHGPSYTFWLAPEPVDPLVRLQAALWREVPDLGGTRQHQGGFTPHLSVGQIRGRQSAEDLLADLQRAWQPLRFEVSSISLIWRNEPPEDVFRVGQTVNLGGP